MRATSDRIAATLERIAAALEQRNGQMEAKEREDITATAAFVMRESCAEEIERLYGPEAAAEVRKVPLPHEAETL